VSYVTSEEAGETERVTQGSLCPSHAVDASLVIRGVGAFVRLRQVVKGQFEDIPKCNACSNMRRKSAPSAQRSSAEGVALLRWGAPFPSGCAAFLRRGAAFLPGQRSVATRKVEHCYADAQHCYAEVQHCCAETQHCFAKGEGFLRGQRRVPARMAKGSCADAEHSCAEAQHSCAETQHCYAEAQHCHAEGAALLHGGRSIATPRGSIATRTRSIAMRKRSIASRRRRIATRRAKDSCADSEGFLRG
jgi:hypothetical protein